MASIGEDNELTDTITDNKEAGEIVLPVSKRSKGIVKDPNFAVVCSFIQIFGPLLRFQELSIETIQHFFDSPSEGNQDDVETLFIKLLRRAGYKVVPEKWEKGLLKLARDFDISLAWDLEQFGFKELPGEAKLALLKYLLESQFDKNDKFKSAVNCELTLEDLRPKPIGSDIDGLIYWFQEDELLQIRLYSTEEDEVDCEAWKVLACEVDEMMDVVSYLEQKSMTNPKDMAKLKKEEKRKQYTLKIKQKKLKKNLKGKKSKKQADTISEDDSINESPGEESDLDDDDPCARCYSSTHPEWILLCDKCDAAYHTACLRPPLMQIPAGDWFCPYCNTLSLIDTLKQIHLRISTRIKARSRAASRQNAYGINLSNIRQSGRVRKAVDYTFAEFDQEISDAVGVGKRDGARSETTSISVGQFYSSGRNTRQSRRQRGFYADSDSDSKDSEYELPVNQGEPEEPKHPERHVYLRRHEKDGKQNNMSSLTENDDEDDDEDKHVEGCVENGSSVGSCCSENIHTKSEENIFRNSDETNENESSAKSPAGDEPLYSREIDFVIPTKKQYKDGNDVDVNIFDGIETSNSKICNDSSVTCKIENTDINTIPGDNIHLAFH